MTDLIFSFDTEDYVNEYAAQGIIRAAQLLRSEGIRGSFQMVGLMAEALVEWGRQDVIDELRQYHEIAIHSHRHSMHPTINEYTDRADFDRALAEFIEDESRGIEKVRKIFDVKQDLLCACPPGMSTSYVAHYGYAKMGFEIYSGDSLFDARRNRPVYSCNIPSLEYNYSLEKFLFTATEESIKEFLDRTVAPKDVFVLYHHPQRSMAVSYYDLDNFKGFNLPKDKRIPTPRHTDEEIETFYRNFRFLVRTVKNDPRFNVITHGELCEKLRGKRTLTREMLPEIKKQLEEDFFPVTLPDSFCLADVYHACADFLCGKDEHECGDVYGFLDRPYAVKKPVTLSVAEITELAHSIKADGFLPEYLLIDDKKINPADWLRAALAVLVDGVKEYTVTPNGAWQIDLDQFPFLRDLRYTDPKHIWCHCDFFEDRYLSDRFRLQSWTIRLPKGTDRKIF